jgi:hypothetical protein
VNLTVVHLPATGHVVGAITGIGLPDEPALTDLVGPDALVLHLRTGDNNVAELRLPMADLAAATVPDPLNALVTPMAYQFDKTGPKLVKLSDSLVSTHPVALTNNAVTVTVSTAVTEDTAVVVVLGTDQPPLTGTLAKNSSTLTLPTSLDPGTYAVLLLMAGQFGLLDVCKVS